MFVPPSNVIVSPPATASVDPVSAAMFKPVAILAVLTAVTKPFALIVKTGTLVVEPTWPTSELTVANVVEIVAVSPAFWKVAVPVASPLTATVTALESPFASSAVPVKSPTKPVLAVIVEPVIAAAVFPPITVPSIEPPSISIAFAA